MSPIKIFLISLATTVFVFFIVCMMLVLQNHFADTGSYSLLQLTSDDLNIIWLYYSENIRGNLFSGLIAVGAFLMTGQTFILVTMKQNVFDDPAYIKLFEERKLAYPHIKLERYDPLINLNKILHNAIIAAVFAAISQLTIGLMPHYFLVIVCVFFAILSIAYLIESLILIKSNLDYWLSMEKETSNKEAKDSMQE